MSEIRVDTISEKTSANGVAVDGVGDVGLATARNTLGPGRAVLVGLDRHEHCHPGIELGRLEQRHPLADHAIGFELLHPPPAGRGRQMHPLGQGVESDRGILLQQAENFQVGGVQGNNFLLNG